jgi:hypothetical protein
VSGLTIVATSANGHEPRLFDNACTGAYHLSRRTSQSVLGDLFGVALGLGILANLGQATAQAAAKPMAEARAYVQAQPVAYAGETAWREGQQRAWLWTVVTACFHTRKLRTPKELLDGDHRFPGARL